MEQSGREGEREVRAYRWGEKEVGKRGEEREGEERLGLDARQNKWL